MIPFHMPAMALGLVFALSLPGQAFVFSSEHADFSIAATSEITDNPVGIQDWNECYPASDDFSAPGRILADGDWVVTAELRFHDFELVSFAAIAKAEGGGRCEFLDGKIAVWQDGAFVALIGEAVPDQLLIGQIREMDGTVVEIRSGAAQPGTTGYIAYDAATEELFITAQR